MGFLRYILAISVVINHSDSFFGFKFTGGVVSVEVFFIISGFYMAMILNKKYVGKGSYLLFLSNRFLRLYPIFWVILLLTILASVVLYFFSDNWLKLAPYINYVNVLSGETLLFLIASNIALFGQDAVMFLGVSTETGEMFFTDNFRTTSPMLYKFLFVPQAWTLGIELMFYLIAPFIVRKSNLLVIVLIVSSLLVKSFIHYYLELTNDPWTYRFFPSEIAFFLIGTMSYRLYDVYKIQHRVVLSYSLSKFMVAVFFVNLLFFQFIAKAAGIGQLFNWFFYGLSCLSIPYLFELSKTSKVDSRIGELSYPIYISHILVIITVAPFSRILDLEEYSGEVAVISTTIVSYILVRVVSDPIEKIRQSRVKEKTRNTLG